MKKIWLVTHREYLSRVKKKSFIIMTLLGPLLIGLFYGAIFWVMSNESKKDKERLIEIIDDSGVMKGKLKNTEYLLFTYTDEKVDDARKNLDSSSFYGVLYFPPSFTLDRPVGIQLFTREQSSIAAQERLENSIEKELKAQRMEQAGLSKAKIDSLNVKVDMNVLVNNGGESKKSETGLLTAIGFALTFLMYMFVFIYGVQVMRGVMEEKTNRIVEVVISTVRPFQLMMGKIFGIAMVGLTQFLVWALLGGGLVFLLTLFLGPQMEGAAQMQSMQGGMQPDSAEMAERFAEIGSSISLGLIIKYLLIFLFYFIFGYLMYSSLFAAVGSAVDNETDTQQFMLPITMPIVFSFIVSISSITNDPHSSLAWWMSIIPLTSPVTMMARLPFIEGHEWDLVLSMVLLVLGFVGFTWLAGRIYRTGILMYGKKVTYKEIIKWIRYKG